jgi:hypothetical protein
LFDPSRSSVGTIWNSEPMDGVVLSFDIVSDNGNESNSPVVRYELLDDVIILDSTI